MHRPDLVRTAWFAPGAVAGAALLAGVAAAQSPAPAPDVTGVWIDHTGRGAVEITSTTPDVANSPQSIPVTLTVTSGTLSVSPAQLTFTQASGGPAPAAQTIQVSSSGPVLNWTASASMNIGQNWLAASPASGAKRWRVEHVRFFSRRVNQ